MEERIVKLSDGFEIHIVNPDKKTKPVTEKDVFEKMLEKYEEKDFVDKILGDRIK